MSDYPLIWILPIATMILVVGFALWSKRRTDDALENDTSETTPLARREPDPNFTPDRKVTNPQNVRA